MDEGKGGRGVVPLFAVVTHHPTITTTIRGGGAGARPMTAPTVIHRMVERCRAGAYPPAVARLRSGWVVIGARQVLSGYCLLLPDPVVPHLNALPPELRAQFLSDMAMVGDALLAVTAALRINYAIFGNVDPPL